MIPQDYFLTYEHLEINKSESRVPFVIVKFKSTIFTEITFYLTLFQL